MSKKSNVRRYYLEVQAWGSADGSSDQKFACEDIASQIKRHVDDVGHIEIQEEMSYTCEHCGYGWTETSNTFNGGCCEKDMDEQDARAAAIAT